MLYLCKPEVTRTLELSPDACQEAYRLIAGRKLRPTWATFNHKVHPDDHKFNLLRPGRLRKVLDNLDQVLFVSFMVNSSDYADSATDAEVQRLAEVGLSGFHRIVLQPEELVNSGLHRAAVTLSEWSGVKLETHLTVPLRSTAVNWHIDHAGSEYGGERTDTISPGTFNYPYQGVESSYVEVDNKGSVQTAANHRSSCYFMNPRDVRHRVVFEENAPQRRLLMFRQIGFDVERLARSMSVQGLLEELR